MVSGYWSRELRSPTALAIYALIAAMLVAGFSSDVYVVNVANDLMFWIALAASLNIIMGFAGYVSFGHVVFVGLGGYIMAIVMEMWLPGLADSNQVAAAALGVVLGAAAGAALAGSIGAIVLRLRGVFFAIATIGLDLAIMYLIIMLPTPEGGGEIYFAHIPRMETITWFTWAVFTISLLSMMIVKKSRLGMGLQAIREDEDAAESLGVPTALYKTIAYTISGALAGAMGAVYAWRTMSVTPAEAFNLVVSIKMIVMVVVGGLGTILGPVVGGFIYYLIYLYLTTNPQLSPLADMAMGLLAIIIILFLPRGVIGYLRLLRAKIAGKPLHKILE